MTAEKKRIVVAYLVGLLFGVGLVVGGMTQPGKVIGFLDFAGSWDPSLIFVMGGAIVVFMPLFRLVMRRNKPVCDANFGVPTRNDIDAPLVVGAGFFGIGWGLAGYCPGPALTSLGGAAQSAFIFTVAMLAGFALERSYKTLVTRRDQHQQPA